MTSEFLGTEFGREIGRSLRVPFPWHIQQQLSPSFVLK